MSDVDRLTAALAGRYAIERELGSGGMATVYLAEDLRHKRQVALKVLKPDLAAVLGAERFVQEITTTASLQHPHILPLFDSGEAGGFLYYVMPFIHGETLRDKLDRETQLGIDEAVRITTDIASALDYAHRNNIVHRDIKPENILLHDGRPMVADFGIALAVSAAAGGRMTETGMSLGTPHYMSPEQATADKDLTARSDIYSLGSVLYEMLTGEPPHLGGSAQAIIMKIVTEEVQPVTAIRKSVPPHVASATAKSLEKLPADRFESAKAFADALGDAAFTSPSMAAPVGASNATARGATWKVMASTAGFALLAGIVVGWMLRPVPETPIRPVQFFIESDSAHLISTSAGVAVSPDGTVLVYGARTGAGSMLYRRRIDELEPQPIPGTETGQTPFFSPDGMEIGFEDPAYGGGRSLRRVRLDGSPPRTITADYEGNVLGADWREDGLIVFSTWLPSHVYTVNANGGAAELLGPLEAVVDSVAIASPTFLSDNAIAFASFGLDTRIGVVSLRSQTVRWLMPGAAPRYLPSGQLVYAGSDASLFVQPFDLGKLDTAGTARRVAEGLAIGLGGFPILAVSPSGTITYGMAGSEGRDLVLVDRRGNEQVLLKDGQYWVPRFSPDGNRIVFGQTGGDEDIWVHDIVRETTTRLTLDGLGNNDPVWSPDGSSIAFSRDFDAKDLYMLSASGGSPTPLVVVSGTQWTSDWSSDGYLVFTNNAASADIWVASVDGSDKPRPYLATPNNESAGRVSPNGRWLAFHSDESGQREVYVQSFPEPGNKQLISTAGGENPMWGPDGRELFYWDPTARLIAHRLTAEEEVAVGDREVLFQFPDYLTHLLAQYDVHPSGQQFVIVKNEMKTGLVVGLDLTER